MRSRNVKFGIFAFRSLGLIKFQNNTFSTRSIGIEGRCKLTLKDRMIKLSPLSGLVKSNNTGIVTRENNQEGTLVGTPTTCKEQSEIELDETHSEGNERNSQSFVDEGIFCSPHIKANPIKKSVIRNEILQKVSQTVRAQVDDGTFDTSEAQNEILFEKESSATSPELVEIETEESIPMGTFRSSCSDSDNNCESSKKWQEVSAKKSVKKRKKDNRSEHHGNDGDGNTEKKRAKKVMPNYFIAVQIADQKVHNRLREVQQKVEQQNPALSAAMIPLPTLHITIMVMHLPNDEEVERAKVMLMHCGRKLEHLLDSPITLDVCGIGHFGNSVVYTKVNEGRHLDKLHQIADIVMAVFRENEINLAGEKGFKPHITIMKLSRSPKLRKKGIKRIDSKYYDDYVDKHFGSSTIQSLQLCSMLGPKDKLGYYQVLHSVPLCKPNENVFTADMEEAVSWNYTPGPAPEPLEPTEEEKISLLSAIRSSSKGDTVYSKAKVPKRTFGNSKLKWAGTVTKKRT